jgi:MFS family permease
MAQSSISMESPNFGIGRVIGTSLSVFSRNLVPFFVLALVIGLPYIGISLGLMSSFDVETIERIKQTGQVPSGFWGMIIVGSLIYLLTYVVTQSVIIYGTFQDLRGQKAAFGDCLTRGFAVLPRVLIAAILAAIAITIGWMLLFVPAIILILMWWVFVPVLVIEGAGIIECFGRSRGLTRGHRWGILGLLVIVFVAQWLVGLVLGVLGAALGTIAGEILNFIVMFLFTAFAAVLVAVGYYYLRAEKEGIVIDDIARVFD